MARRYGAADRVDLAANLEQNYARPQRTIGPIRSIQALPSAPVLDELSIVADTGCATAQFKLTGSMHATVAIGVGVCPTDVTPAIRTNGVVFTDTITEHTAALGVTIESVRFLDSRMDLTTNATTLPSSAPTIRATSTNALEIRGEGGSVAEVAIGVNHTTNPTLLIRDLGASKTQMMIGGTTAAANITALTNSAYHNTPGVVTFDAGLVILSESVGAGVDYWRIQNDAAGPIYQNYKARGADFSSMSACLAEDRLVAIWAGGHDGTSGFLTQAKFEVRAAENWTATQRGTRMDFYTTKIGGTTLKNWLAIDDDGDIHALGTSTDGANFRATGVGPTNFGKIELRTVRTDISTPTATQASDNVGDISIYGYGATAYVRTAQITATARSNFTDTSAYSELRFLTSPSATVTPQENLVLDSSLGAKFPSEGSARFPRVYCSYWGGTYNPAFVLENRGGTEASPTATNTANISGIWSVGYDGSADRIAFTILNKRNGTWDASNHGSTTEFQHLPKTATTSVTCLTLRDHGASSALAWLEVGSASCANVVPHADSLTELGHTSIGAFLGLHVDKIYNQNTGNIAIEHTGTFTVSIGAGSTQHWGLQVTGSSASNATIKIGGRTGDTLAAFGAAGTTKQTVTGSRAGNAALASFLTAMANYGFITDSTSA